MNNWLVSREAIESNIGKSLTEEQWANIADEVAGRADNFLEEILPAIIEEKVGA